MSRLPADRREVRPSKRAMGKRNRPDFGPGLGVSVPISVGLPLIVVGLFLVITAATRGGALVLWVLGGVALGLGATLFASGRRI